MTACSSTRHLLPGIVLTLLLALPLQARTILITDEDCGQMAAIAAAAPLLGWAAAEVTPDTYLTNYIELVPGRAFLIRYPLDKLPRGQRITRAEWTIPIQYYAPLREQRIYVRRILPEWGAGVCHQYRMLRPRKEEWKTPGAAAAGTDRVARPSGVVRINATGEQVINVTEDVELWYTGAAPNNGWILTMEDNTAVVRCTSPLWLAGGCGAWKLRITYEPE